MSDRLDRALRALREQETGKNESSEETLDRVLAKRRAASGVWTKRVRLWMPIAAVLVMATTAFAGSGKMGRFLALFKARSEVTEHHETGGGLAVPVVPAAASSALADTPPDPALLSAGPPAPAPAPRGKR